MLLSTPKFLFDHDGLANETENDDVELRSYAETRGKEERERETSVKLGLLSNTFIGVRRE